MLYAINGVWGDFYRPPVLLFSIIRRSFFMVPHRVISIFSRWLALVVGLFFMGFGVCLIIKSNLGTSPISSVPLILSYIFPLSLGAFTFLLSLLFIFLEIIIAVTDFKSIIFFQLFVGPVFGFFIDICMILFGKINVTYYPSKLFILLLGCIVLSLGIVIQVKANVVMNPGEGLVRAIAKKTNRKFGTIKTLFDSSLVIIAFMLSLLFLHGVNGIREGTIISAIIVGFLTKWINGLLLHFAEKKSSFISPRGASF